jgi:hypothetical protein
VGAVERVIVKDHQLAVLRHADVGLEAAETFLVAAAEGKQGVFFELEGTAAMGEMERLFRLRLNRLTQDRHQHGGEAEGSKRFMGLDMVK